MILVVDFFFILLMGFFVQYIDGTLGMGYGASSSSFLIAMGLTPALVSASVHTSEIFASLTSGISHLRFGNVKMKIAFPLTISGVIGGFLGAYFLSNIPGDLVKPFVGIILLILGIRIFLKFFWRKHIKLIEGEFSWWFLVFLGFIGGFVDAFGGGGWGPICTSTLVSVNKTKPKFVIGSVNFAEFFTTIVIVITFGIILSFENFLWNITIPLIIGGIIAAPLAAFTCKNVSPRILGSLIGIILIILNTRILVDSLLVLLCVINN